MNRIKNYWAHRHGSFLYQSSSYIQNSLIRPTCTFFSKRVHMLAFEARQLNSQCSLSRCFDDGRERKGTRRGWFIPGGVRRGRNRSRRTRRRRQRREAQDEERMGVRARSAAEHEESLRDEVNVLRRCIASRTRGRGIKGPSSRQ